jgi:hypothetical protein
MPETKGVSLEELSKKLIKNWLKLFVLVKFCGIYIQTEWR